MKDENGLDLADPAWRERCDFCRWPLGPREKGCAAPDDCAQRPRPSNGLTVWKQEIRKLEAALAEHDALRVQLAEQTHFHRVNRDGFEAMTKRVQELEAELARLHRELYGTEGELQSRVAAIEAENRQLREKLDGLERPLTDADRNLA